MQVRAWWTVWARAVVMWLCGRTGVEVVRPNWRQIPAGRADFDPALAAFFKASKKKNAVTLAAAYAVIDNWNRSNARRREDERTYGSDSDYTRRWVPWLDRKVWGRTVDELSSLKLVEISTKRGRPAFRALGYEVQGDGQLRLWGGHDVQTGGQNVHPSIENRTILKSSTPKKPTAAMAEAKAAAAADGFLVFPKFKVRSWAEVQQEAAELRELGEGVDDLLLASQRTDAAPRPYPPVASPPFPGTKNPHPILSRLPCGKLSPALTPNTGEGENDTAVDEEATQADEMAGLRLFFTGLTREGVEALVDKHGLATIQAHIRGVKGRTGVDNPPGLVLSNLRKGGAAQWQYPGGGGHYAEGDGRAYVTGKYADFIKY